MHLRCNPTSPRKRGEVHRASGAIYALPLERVDRRAAGARHQILVRGGQRFTGIAKPIGDWIAAVAPKIAARDLDARGGLPALIFGDVKQMRDARDRVAIEAGGD